MWTLPIITTSISTTRLRREAEQKRRNLEEEREDLVGRREGVLQSLRQVQDKYEETKVRIWRNKLYINIKLAQ